MKLQDAAFVAPNEAAANRQTLVEQYVAAFRQVEAAANDKAGATLKEIAASVSTRIVPDRQHALHALLDEQRAKIAWPSRKAVELRRVVDQDAVAHRFVRHPHGEQVEQQRVVGLVGPVPTDAASRCPTPGAPAPP